MRNITLELLYIDKGTILKKLNMLRAKNYERPSSHILYEEKFHSVTQLHSISSTSYFWLYLDLKVNLVYYMERNVHFMLVTYNSSHIVNII